MDLDGQNSTDVLLRQVDTRKSIVARVGANTKYTVIPYNHELLDASLTLVDKNIKMQDKILKSDVCSCCEEVLTEPLVKCADCVPPILICLSCFASGGETTNHRNYHSYRIIRDDLPVFSNHVDWAICEERILLHALRTHGYGNWEAVSRALNYRHTIDECRQHYHDYYFGGIFERLIGLTHGKECYFPERMPYVYKMRSVDPPRYDDIASMQFKITAGYRCARSDFDTPYDMSAERLVAIMSYSHQHEIQKDLFCSLEVERELQYALVRAYNHRLKERQRRYRIMRDHGLIMPNRTLGWISKYADAFHTEANCTSFLAFMQVLEPIKFDLIVESLKNFIDLQKAVYRLCELRQNGVRSMNCGLLYFKLKKRRSLMQHECSKRSRDQLSNDWRKIISHDFNSSNSKLYGDPKSINQRKKPAPIDIIGLPGFAKLDEGERNLCSIARIIPQAYLDFKNILITENAKIGHLRLADARRLIKIDVNKTRQIYDFLITNGHIKKSLN